MIPLSVKLDSDGAYPDAKELGAVTSMGLLSNGTISGQGAVMVEITAPDGTKHYGQTTVNLLKMASSAIVTRDEMNRGG